MLHQSRQGACPCFCVDSIHATRHVPYSHISSRRGSDGIFWGAWSLQVFSCMSSSTCAKPLQKVSEWKLYPEKLTKSKPSFPVPRVKTHCCSKPTPNPQILNPCRYWCFASHAIRTTLLDAAEHSLENRRVRPHSLHAPAVTSSCGAQSHSNVNGGSGSAG